MIRGGGSGGYAAALRAAGQGLSVAPAEKTELRDTCPHQGCIPTEAPPHTGAVTIVEALPHLVPMEDEDSSRQLERAIRRRGVNIELGMGRRPLSAGLGGEAAGFAEGEAAGFAEGDASPDETAQPIHACPTRTKSMGQAHPALTGKPLHAHD
ncbi:hypothetical protein QR77_23795 [Streptomyces sp. 150FB]|nr:hypothetical protein QR77_23795 [Streptomyces sp. 150FB]